MGCGREAGGLLGQCRDNGSGLLLLAWRLSGGQYRFFPVVLRLLNKDQRRALTTKHLREAPADLPMQWCLGHGNPPQRAVNVSGLDGALSRAFDAAASIDSSESTSESSDSD